MKADTSYCSDLRDIYVISIIFLIEHHRFLFIPLLYILKDGHPQISTLFLHLFGKLLVLYFFVLNVLQPSIIMPNRLMIVRFEVHRFRLTHADSAI